MSLYSCIAEIRGVLLQVLHWFYIFALGLHLCRFSVQGTDLCAPDLHNVWPVILKPQWNIQARFVLFYFFYFFHLGLHLYNTFCNSGCNELHNELRNHQIWLLDDRFAFFLQHALYAYGCISFTIIYSLWAAADFRGHGVHLCREFMLYFSALKQEGKSQIFYYCNYCKDIIHYYMSMSMFTVVIMCHL